MTDHLDAKIEPEALLIAELIRATRDDGSYLVENHRHDLINMELAKHSPVTMQTCLNRAGVIAAYHYRYNRELDTEGLLDEINWGAEYSRPLIDAFRNGLPVFFEGTREDVVSDWRNYGLVDDQKNLTGAGLAVAKAASETLAHFAKPKAGNLLSAVNEKFAQPPMVEAPADESTELGNLRRKLHDTRCALSTAEAFIAGGQGTKGVNSFHKVLSRHFPEVAEVLENGATEGDYR